MSECRICGQHIRVEAWGGGDCCACGSISVATVPSAEELTEYYHSFNKTYSGGGRSGGRNLARYARKYLRIVTGYRRTGRLLDVGSSTSPFPNFARESGFGVTVMDYEKPDLLNPDIGFVQGNLAGEGLCESLESTFDVVTAWAVIEHVPDPARAIECLVRMVRPGGYVMLSTPEVGTLLTRYAGGRTRWFCPPEHLHLVSPRGIKFLFGRQGCDVLRCARLELNPLRWVGRYGIGLAEAVLGATVKSVSTSRWERRRLERMLRFQGIIYCVIRKRQQPERSEVLH